jgi:hypothetical protein
MPVLPIIDLLIFLGWTVLSIGGVLKAIYISTSYRPTFLTLTPIDCLLAGGICLLLSLTLAARTWVKTSEPQILATRRAAGTLEAYEEAQRHAREQEDRDRQNGGVAARAVADGVR